MMIEIPPGKIQIIMKNHCRNGSSIFFVLLAASLFSCKKETAPVAGSATESTVENIQVPYVNDPADLVPPDESVTAGTVSMNAVTTASLTAGTRKNLIFNFPTEADNSLAVVSNNSATAYASLQRYSTAYSIQRTSAYARTGSYSTRYELRKTDGDIGLSKRSETCRYTKSEPVVKVERWYAASYFLPADYAVDGAPELVTQWHTNIGSPPLALWIQNGQWRIVQFGNRVTVVGAHDRNKWTDFVYHVKWSTGADGLVEIWKNGTKIFTKTGQNIYTGTASGAYMRTGIYKWPWKSGSTPASTTTKRVLYIDDVRIGNNLATYYDVAPGNY